MDYEYMKNEDLLKCFSNKMIVQDGFSYSFFPDKMDRAFGFPPTI